MAEQEPLTTEFNLHVTVEVTFDVAVKPRFDLNTLEGTNFNRNVGEEWKFTLPSWDVHELGYFIQYDTVDLKESNLFAEYNEDDQLIHVPVNATTEKDVGEYKILLRLVDAVGVKSDPLTISLVIVSNGSDEESVSAVDAAIGEFYAKVFEDREAKK